MTRLYLLCLALLTIACSSTDAEQPDVAARSLSCFAQDSRPAADEQATSWAIPDAPVAGPVIDCQGGERGPLVIRHSGTVVRNCTIRGSVRIRHPDWSNTNQLEPASKTRTADYVDWIRSVAPTHVTIQDSTIIGTRNSSGTCSTPLFVSTGVTYTLVRDVEINGCSDSVMVYLESESSRTRFRDVVIHGENADREAIAIDASDHNSFTRVTVFHREGGLFLYRNCGESGRTRVTTPSFNASNGLTLRGGDDFLGRDLFPGVWFASRSGLRCYCGDDEPGQYGSAQSNMDHARSNAFAGVDLGPGGWLIDDGAGNSVSP